MSHVSMTSCYALSLLHRRADVVDFELIVSINVLFTDHKHVKI